MSKSKRNNRKKRSKNSSGGGSRRRKRGSRSNRRRNSGKSRGRRSSRGKAKGGNKQDIPREQFGGRKPRQTSSGSQKRETLPVNAFELFCTYHLGITDDNRYKRFGFKELARRFDLSTEEFEEALKRYGLHKSQLGQVSEFDMSLAHLDVKVAPEGVDKREIGKMLFEELLRVYPRLWEAMQDAGESPP